MAFSLSEWELEEKLNFHEEKTRCWATSVPEKPQSILFNQKKSENELAPHVQLYSSVRWTLQRFNVDSFGQIWFELELDEHKMCVR